MTGVTIYTPRPVYRHPGLTIITGNVHPDNCRCRDCTMARHPAGKARR